MTLEPWITQDEEVPFENRWVRVRLQSVLLPDGNEYEYTVVDRPKQGVGVFLQDDAGRFLLEREYRHGVGQVVWQVPGGLLDTAEPAIDSAKRELLEETGYEAGSWSELGFFYDNPALGNASSQLFLAREPRRIAEPNPDHAEWVELHWVAVEWIREALTRNEIVDRVVLSGLALLWARRII